MPLLTEAIVKIKSILGCAKPSFASEQCKEACRDDIVSIMTETAGGCYWEWDVCARRLLLIPDGSLIFGKSVSTNDEFLKLIHPDDAFLFKKRENHFFITDPSLTSAPDEAEGMELRMQSMRGEWRWFVIRRSRVRHDSGKIEKVMGSMMDVDAFKRAVEAMRSSEMRLATIFKSAPGSMAVTNADGKLIEANQAFYDMLGYSARELLGVSIMSLSAAGHEKENGELLAKILAECDRSEDKHFRREESFTRSDGKHITVKYGLSAIFDFDGNVTNYIFSGMDITQQIKHSAELHTLSEKQRWLFAFLRQFNQFDGVDRLFDALCENLPTVISFSLLKLIVPSFLDKPWVFDNTRELDEENAAREVAGVLAGVGLPGRAYINRAAVNWDSTLSDEVQSVVAVPLLYKEKTWGVLVLEREWLEAFNDEDVTLINIVGSNIGLYFEERSSRAELDIYTEQLHQLHFLIRSLLGTQNRDQLLEGMLGYLKRVIPDSTCAVYLFEEASDVSDEKLERLAWYDEDDIPVPDNALALKTAHSKTPIVECTETGLESRRVAPIIFQARVVGVVDVFKPIGMESKELEMYQLLTDYVSSFWVLYDLMALREEEASVDPLTGIWNRRYMIRRFQEESDRIFRYGGNACVVLCDMGNFKQINDQFGHTKGDEVLIKVARTLRKCLRTSDSVGRYGGDEFLILLPNISKADTGLVIERIKMELGLLRIKSSDEDADSPLVDVVLDFGVAIFPGEVPVLMDAINLADEDMYNNKTARKKRLGQTPNPR